MALPIAAELAAQIPQPKVFLQGNSMLALNDDADYAPVIDAIHKTFVHLAHSRSAQKIIGSIQERIRDEALDQGTTEQRVMDAQIEVSNITDFLRDSTPCIVLKDLTNGDPSEDALRWGAVLKGEKPEAQKNIIYLEKTLAMVLCANPPPVIAHETIHALNKHTFGPSFVTPRIGGFEDDDHNGKSDAGFTFERDFYGFRLEAVWEQQEFADIKTRMWQMKLVVKNSAVAKTSSEYVQLDPACTVSAFLASISTTRSMQIVNRQLQTYNFDALTQVRGRKSPRQASYGLRKPVPAGFVLIPSGQRCKRIIL